MRIVNETVYNSEDIQALMVKVADLCAQEHETRGRKRKAAAVSKGEVWRMEEFYFQRKPLPELLRVGYYNYRRPEGGKSRKAQQGDQFVSMIRVHSSGPRLGIVKPALLPLNPLTVLAHCAEGAVRTVPAEVVYQIASGFTRGRRGHPGIETLRNLSETHVIRFALKAKRGARKEAKEEVRKARIASLDWKIRVERNSLAALESKMEKHREKLAKLQKRRDKLQPQEQARV
jgi:hypothetical protein